MSRTTATIITIGDELLIGQTIDTNSSWMAQQLHPQGIDICRRIAIGDSREAMKDALDEELRRADILLLTGGLGPTSDDITKPFLIEYFGGKLVIDENVLTHVKDIFIRRNRPFLERNLQQAEVPDNCIVLHNRKGTAPGMWFEKDGKVIISMPGVPHEMICIMEDEVLPRLKERFVSDAIVHSTIVTSGEGESFLAESIQDIEVRLPEHIKLAYLPQAGGVRLRLSAHGENSANLIAEVEGFRDQIAERLANWVVALEDLPLENIVGNLLLELGMTIGLAESCTGGYMAHKFTQIVGSSGFFKGSIVAYHESGKQSLLNVDEKTIQTSGVVSEEVAVEMATGATKALHSDISFAVTGLLSPAEGYEVPAGTVCIAIGNSEKMFSRTFTFHMDRARNKELAVQTGLLFIWRFLKGKI